MSKDFRIKQLRTSQVIVSGSNVGAQPSMLIYSASAATNVSGGTHANLLTGVGTDVWLFVSGSKGVEANTDESVLFGGNVIHSGSLDLKDSLTIKHATGGKITLQSSEPTIAVNDVLGRIEFEAPDETSGGDAILTAAEIAAVAENFFTANFNRTKLSFRTGHSEAATEKMSLNSVGDLAVTGDVQVSGNNIKDSSGNSVIEFAGDSTTTLAGDLNVPMDIKHVGDSNTKINFTGDMVRLYAGGVEGLRIFEGTNDFVTVNDGGADVNFQVKTPGLNAAIFANAGQDTLYFAETSVADLTALDTKIVFGGTPGSKDTNSRGTSVFKGDLVVSGTLFAERQVMEVDLTKTGHLVMSGAVNFKNQTAGSEGNVVVPLNDGAVFAATGSLIGKVRTAAGPEVFKLKEYTPGNGINVIDSSIGSKASLRADPSILAHLTGAFFSGNVGVTGSFGVSEDLSLQTGKFLYFNGAGGDLNVRASDNNTLVFECDDTMKVAADNVAEFNIGGDHHTTSNTIQFGQTAVRFNKYQFNTDFYVNTDNHTGTFFIDGGDDSVIIGAENFDVSPEASELKAAHGYGDDVKIMLSGSAGSKSDTAAEGRGVVLLPGDLVVSGSSYHSDDVNLLANSRLRLNNPGENDQFIYGNNSTIYIDGDNFIQMTADISAETVVGSNLSKHFATKNEFNANKADVDFVVNTNTQNATLFVDGNDESVIIGATAFDVTPQASELKAAHGYGDDVKIMLSGSAGSKSDTAAHGRGVVLVPGDLVVSGSLVGAGGSAFLSNANNGLANNAGVASLSINTLSTTGTINEADTIAFMDADDNTTKKDTIGGLVSAVAGNGLINSSNKLQVNVDNSTLETDSDVIRIKADGVTKTQINSNVAGTGLEQHTDGSIRIATAAAGNGLSGGGGSALTVDLEAAGGLKLKSSNNKLMTDDSKVAHLTGSVFTGDVTFNTGVKVAPGQKVSWGSGGAEQYIQGANAILEIDGDNHVFIDSDMSLQMRIQGAQILSASLTEVVVNQGGQNSPNFRVETNNKEKAIFVNSTFDYVAIGDDAGLNATDAHLFVSGSVGGLGNDGVAVFGGDIVVSGTLYDSNHTPIGQQRSYKENGTFGEGTANAPVATGTDSVAIGTKSRATGNFSLAIGSSENNNTDATSPHALAIGGDDATASGAYSAAIGGSANTAQGQYSVALGRSSTAGGDYSVAIGDTLTTYDARTTIFGSSGSPAAAKVLLSSSLEVNQGTTLIGDVTLGNAADLIIPAYIKHKANVNTYLRFNNDQIRLQTAGSTDVDITADQVKFSPGNQATPAESNGLDVAFYVSGSKATQGTGVRATSLFGGDVHVSGSLSGPESFVFNNANTKIFRDGNNLTFDDGNNTPKTLSQLATVGISDESTFFQGVHGGSNNSKMATTASVSFAGTQGSAYYVENLGADVYMYVSGGLRSDTAAYGRTTTVFGGATVYSGSADFFGPATFQSIAALSITGSQSVTTSLLADSTGNPALSISSQKLAMGPNIAPSTADSAFFTIQKNSATQAGPSNVNSEFQILLKNIDDGDNSFSGIAFDSGNETDPDSIGAAIRGERDSTAGSNMSLHDMNLTFATNDAGDAGLTERMRITHDGKVGIGVSTPSRMLDIDGDIHLRGGDITYGNGQAANLDVDDTAHNVAGKPLTITAGRPTAGTTDDIAGGNLTLRAGQSKGAVAGGNMVFQLSPAAGSSNSNLNSYVDAMTISATDGTVSLIGNLQLGADGRIKNSQAENVITVTDDQNVLLEGDLQVGGDDIKDSGGNTVISFDGSGNVDNGVVFSGNQKPRFIGNNGTLFGDAGIKHDGDEDTKIFFADDVIKFNAGGHELLKLKQDTQSVFVVNEGGIDVDTRFEVFANAGNGTPEHGNVDADHALFIKGDTGQIGLGVGNMAFGYDDARLAIKGVTTNIDPYSSKIWAKLTGSVDDGRLDLYANNAVTTRINANGLSMFSADGFTGDPGLLVVRRDGTTAENDLLGGIGFDSSDGNVPGTVLNASAFIAAYAAEDHSVNDKGGYLVLGTSKIDDNDDTVSTEHLRIEADGLVKASGQLEVTNGIPKSTSVLCNSSIVGVEDRFFKIATLDTGILNNLQGKSTILVTMSGPENSDTFDADDTFLLHVEYTASNASPYYHEEGTHIRVDAISGIGKLEGFNPATDVVMTFSNSGLPTQVDLYIRARESHRSVYTSILGGTTSVNQGNTMEGFRLLSGQTPAFAITSLGTNVFGTWTSKYYSEINLNGGLLFKPAYASVKLAADTDFSAAEYNPFDTDENGSPTEMCSAQGGVTFTASNGRFTVTSPGAYDISANIFLENAQQAAAAHIFMLEKNGNTTLLNASPTINTSAQGVELNLNGIFDLSASDYVEFKIHHKFNGTSQIKVFKGSTFTIKRIG